MATKKMANRAYGKGRIRATVRRGVASKKMAPAASAGRSVRDLEIQTRRVALDPAWRDLIEGELTDLIGRHPQILRTHVTLARSAHEKKGRDSVSIVANAAGRVLRVEKRKETMADALRAALAAFARAAAGLRRPKRARRPRRGREVVPPQPATLEVSR